MPARTCRLLAACAIAIGAGLLAACGSPAHESEPTTTTSTTSTTVPYSHEAFLHYLNALDRLQTAVKPAEEAIGALPSGVSVAEAAAAAAPIGTALVRFETTLTDYTWPTAAQTDVRTLIADAAALQGDVASLANQTASSEPAWNTSFNRDAAILNAQSKVVGADVGLG